MDYTLFAYKNKESNSPEEAKERGAEWEIGTFITDSEITLGDVQGRHQGLTGSPDMSIFNARVDTALGMAEMFGYTGDVALYVSDDNGKPVFMDKGDGWEECKAVCKYCGGNCPNESDAANTCDGFQGDIDGLYSDDSEEEPKTCPECGGVMKFAMLSDSVGNGLHEGHECTDCGHAE